LLFAKPTGIKPMVENLGGLVQKFPVMSKGYSPGSMGEMKL
jgi:hypothetical protein